MNQKQTSHRGLINLDNDLTHDYLELQSELNIVQNKITNWTMVLVVFGVLVLSALVHLAYYGNTTYGMWLCILGVVGVLTAVIRILYLYALLGTVLASLDLYEEF